MPGVESNNVNTTDTTDRTAVQSEPSTDNTQPTTGFTRGSTLAAVGSDESTRVDNLIGAIERHHAGSAGGVSIQPGGIQALELSPSEQQGAAALERLYGVRFVRIRADRQVDIGKENPDGSEYISRASAAGRSDVLKWAAAVLAPRIQRINEEYSAKYNWGNPGKQYVYEEEVVQPASGPTAGLIK